MNAAQNGGSAAQVLNAQNAVAKVVQQQHDSGVLASIRAAEAASAGATGIVGAEIAAVRKAIDTYEQYANQIRTIENLTGASAAASQSFVNLGRVAGVSDSQQIRQVLTLAKDLQSTAGRGALAKLGIAPGGNELETFGKVVSALGQMQDGVQKTNLELQLFKGRSVQALQPFLNLQGDLIAKTALFSANLDDGAIASIQHLQQNVNLLGVAFQNDVIIPLAKDVVPVLDTIVTGVEGAIKVWHDLDKATHGSLTGLVFLTGAATGIIATVTAVNSAVKAFESLQIATKAAAAAQAVLDLLEGPAGWAVLGVAGVGIAGGAYYLNNQTPANGAADKLGGAADKIGDAADSFKEAASTLKSWAQAGGSQVPSNFSESDYTFLRMRTAVGAIR